MWNWLCYLGLKGCVSVFCVLQVIRQLLESHPCLDQPGTWNNQAWAVFMGFEHERIHIETSSVLIREVSQQHSLVPCS